MRIFHPTELSDHLWGPSGRGGAAAQTPEIPIASLPVAEPPGRSTVALVSGEDRQETFMMRWSRSTTRFARTEGGRSASSSRRTTCRHELSWPARMPMRCAASWTTWRRGSRGRSRSGSPRPATRGPRSTISSTPKLIREYSRPGRAGRLQRGGAVRPAGAARPGRARLSPCGWRPGSSIPMRSLSAPPCRRRTTTRWSAVGEEHGARRAAALGAHERRAVQPQASIMRAPT